LRSEGTSIHKFSRGLQFATRFVNRVFTRTPGPPDKASRNTGRLVPEVKQAAIIKGADLGFDNCSNRRVASSPALAVGAMSMLKCRRS
jgi:hypothetical protein